MTPTLSVHFNKIIVKWRDQSRLFGGMPILENTHLKYRELHVEESDTTYSFEFIHNFEDHVEITAKVSPKHQSIVFYLSPHNFHTQQAKDFVGILFDSIQHFKVGNAYYKYGPVTAWTHPVVTHKLEQLHVKNNQFFLYEYTDNCFAACLPLMGKGYVASIGKHEDKLCVKAYHSLDGHNENDIPVLAISFAMDPHTAVQNVYESALGLNDQIDSLKKYKGFPTMFNKLGWCSWNSVGKAVSHYSLMNVAKSFKENNIPVKWMMIDDGWSDVTGPNGKLRSFGPDPVKFPYGLHETVKQLKQEYGIEKVGVWHTVNGYWAGIDPDSELGHSYRDQLHGYLDKVTWTEDSPSVFFLPTPHENKGLQFYEDWYSYLRANYIDFVKVDNLLIPSRVAKGQLDRTQTAKALIHNFQQPAERHFEGIINCMSLTNDILHHLGNLSLARSSEDYWPENTTFNLQAGNEAVHIFNNIQNNVWLTPLIWTDFDMFQTHRAHAHYHALGLALNNGPIYTTDYPNRFNKDIYTAISYTTGELIKCNSPLLPINQSLFQTLHEGIFWAQSYYHGTMMLGAWNTTNKYQTSTIALSTLLCTPALVYDWNKREAFIQQPNETIRLELQELTCNHFQLIAQPTEFEPIGLIEKFIPIAGVLCCTRKNKYFEIHLKETGLFYAFTSSEIIQVLDADHSPVSIEVDDHLLKIASAPLYFTIAIT